MTSQRHHHPSADPFLRQVSQEGPAPTVAYLRKGGQHKLFEQLAVQKDSGCARLQMTIHQGINYQLAGHGTLNAMFLTETG